MSNVNESAFRVLVFTLVVGVVWGAQGRVRWRPRTSPIWGAPLAAQTCSGWPPRGISFIQFISRCRTQTPRRLILIKLVARYSYEKLCDDGKRYQKSEVMYPLSAVDCVRFSMPRSVRWGSPVCSAPLRKKKKERKTNRATREINSRTPRKLVLQTTCWKIYFRIRKRRGPLAPSATENHSREQPDKTTTNKGQPR